MSKVLVDSTGCHEWQSTKSRQGYGKFWFEGKQVPAHRMAYMIFEGAIPDGLIICHHCDNPGCVNPEHLYAGTHKDNFNDMLKRFRHWGRRKLSDEQVLEILELIEQGAYSQRRIGEMYNVSQITISRIKLKKRHYLKALKIK